MMNRFTQHIPTFVETMGAPPDSFDFETTEQLLAHEDIKCHTAFRGFSRFVKSDHYLMTESNDGFSWWVVGYLKDPDAVDLPQWQGWKFMVREPGGDGAWRVVAGSEVASSCGDLVTLRDGTVCEKRRKVPNE